MFSKLSIKVKLIIYITSLCLGVLLTSSIFYYFQSKTLLKDVVADKFHRISLQKNKNLSYINKKQRQILYHLAQNPEFLYKIRNREQEKLREKLKSYKTDFDFSSIALYDAKGKMVSYTKDVIKGHILLDITKSNNSDFSIIETKINSNTYYSYHISQKIMVEHRHIGYLVGEIDITKVFFSQRDFQELGKSGECMIIKETKDSLKYLTPLRKNTKAHFKRSYAKNSSGIYKQIKKHKQELFEYKDYAGDKVLSLISKNHDLNWYLVTKINKAEAFESSNYLIGIILFTSITAFIFSIMISSMFVNRFLKPIVIIRDKIIALSNGYFPKKQKLDADDEIGEAVNALNSHIDNLKESMDFAHQLGKQNLDFDLELNKKDVLSLSLMRLQKNLKKSKEKDKQRNWQFNGTEMVNNVFNNFGNDLATLCKELLASLIPYTEASYGGIYLKNKEGDHFEKTASYGIDFDKMPNSFVLGQNMSGQALKENKITYSNNLPKGFILIESGLGENSPTHLVIVPMYHNKLPIGVIEIGSFDKVEEYKVEFINRIAKGLASFIQSK